MKHFSNTRFCIALVSKNSAKQPCATELSYELLPRRAHTTRVQKQIQNVGVQLVLDKHQTFVPEQRICCAPSFLEAHREIPYVMQDLLQTLAI